VNHALIYPCNRNLESVYLGRCRDNWVREDAETGSPPPPGDTPTWISMSVNAVVSVAGEIAY
jgi:hypothetical protein